MSPVHLLLYRGKKAEEIQYFADRKQFIAQKVLVPPHYSVQMEVHF